MELRKNPKQDVNKKRGLYFQVGLLVAMGLVVSAFEWKSYSDNQLDMQYQVAADNALMDPIITRMPPPKRPKPKLIKIALEKTEDAVDIDDIKDIFEPVIDIPDGYVDPDPIDEPEPIIDAPFKVVETPAEYPGGYKAWSSFIVSNMRYPSTAQRIGVEGIVYVQFIINEKGELTNAKIVRGIGAGCDQEALRVVQKSTNWSPPKQRGVPVKQIMVMPITFKLKH